MIELLLAEGFTWAGLGGLMVLVLTCLGGLVLKGMALYHAQKLELMALARAQHRAGGAAQDHLDAETASDPKLAKRLRKTQALAKKQVDGGTK